MNPTLGMIFAGVTDIGSATTNNGALAMTPSQVNSTLFDIMNAMLTGVMFFMLLATVSRSMQAEFTS